MKYKEYGLHELKVLRNATKGVHARDKKGVLFGYSHFPAGPELHGAYGGFSFLLYETGLIEVQEYLFSNILAEERRYCAPEVCVSKIKLLFHKYYDRIHSLNAPRNHSFDGGYSCFFFGNKWLSALNICYHDDIMYDSVKNEVRKEFDDYDKIMLAENDILDLFFDVCDILKQYDIMLEQFSVTVFGDALTGYEGFWK